MRSIIWGSDTLPRALRDQLSSEIITVVNSAREFLAVTQDGETVAFMDTSTLAQLASNATPAVPVILICDGTLQTAVSCLGSHPWVSQVVSATTLTHANAKRHLANITAAVLKPSAPKLLDWLARGTEGRRVRLAQASRRSERLEKMGEYFETNGVGARTVQLLRDVAEELLTNAFYDAPVAAGTVQKPISRTQDVSLPDDSACDMVYACSDDLAIVRVRDPFGALTRDRLVQVLTRCARTDMQVEVDETMGGAGLGLWRIFSVATFVAISVNHNRSTEFLVGIRKRPGAGPKPFAFHLFFRDGGKAARWKVANTDPNDKTVTDPVTIVTK